MRFLLSFVAAALILAGCAVTPEQRAKNAPGAVQLAADQGLIALKITSNRPAVSTFFGKWNALSLRNVDTKESFTLTDRADSSAGHSLFVQALPAGRYALEGVGNAAYGAATITSRADASGAFPMFRVAAGQLTDLGTLAYMRRHFPVNTPVYYWGQVESPLDRQAILRQLEPSLATRLAERPVLAWEPTKELEERRATYAQFQQATLRVLAPTPLRDGSMMFGESFGQIAVRAPNGEWRWMQTPTALPIRALQADEDGTLYAGSDEGILLKRAAGAGEWQSIPIPLKDGSILHIGSTPGARDLLVIVQGRDRFVGLSTSRSAPGQWTEQFSRPRALFLNTTTDAQGKVFTAGEKIFLATGSVEAQREIVRYDTSERAWKPVALSSKGSTATWVPFSDGRIGAFAGIPLTGMYFNVSADYGTSWQRLGDLNWANGSLMFVSDATGFVVRTDSIPVSDPEKLEVSLWRTDDGGRSWNKVAPLPALHGTLVALRGAEQLGYASANGKFLVSADGGKSWRAERELP
jgi:hypothetical protein